MAPTFMVGAILFHVNEMHVKIKQKIGNQKYAKNYVHRQHTDTIFKFQVIQFEKGVPPFFENGVQY